MGITKVFFNGRLMTQKKAVSLMLRKMIEEEAPNLPNFRKNEDPYKYIFRKLMKTRSKSITVHRIRNWCYEKGKGGAPPTLEDFFMIVQITKSNLPLEFICSLIDDKNALSQSNIYGEVFEEIGDFIEELGKQLKIKATEYKNGNITN